MISHPLDAPSNFSDSVSSMIRLLISNRIMAADTGARKGGRSVLLGGINRFVSNSANFFSPLTDRTASVEATSACHFRVFYNQDPNREGVARMLVVNS